MNEIIEEYDIWRELEMMDKLEEEKILTNQNKIMEIKKSGLTLDATDDNDFIELITLIGKLDYGEMTIRIKKGRPYQVVKTVETNLLLNKKRLTNGPEY